MPQCGGSRKERHTSDRRFLGGASSQRGVRHASHSCVYTIHTQDWGGGARFAWSPGKASVFTQYSRLWAGITHAVFIVFFGGWLISKRGPVPVNVNTCVPCESRIFALLTCKILFLEAKLSQKRHLLPQTLSFPSLTRPA